MDFSKFMEARMPFAMPSGVKLSTRNARII